MRNLWKLLAFACLLLSYGAKTSGQGIMRTDTDRPAFSLPAVPDYLMTPQSRATYVVSHYWEGLSFSDSRFLAEKDLLEQIYVDFINILPIAQENDAKKATQAMIQKAYDGKVLQKTFVDLSEKYLYNPNSPSYNENIYLWILEEQIRREKTPAQRNVYSTRYKMLSQNRPGDFASDFSVQLSDGRSIRLSDIHTDYILLFFNNPDCDDCRRMKQQMERSGMLKNAVSQRRLTILAVYPDGDLPLWKASKYPSFMLNGFDEDMTILKKGTYDLKAMPTLYLLDKDHRVLLKDATLESVLSHI